MASSSQSINIECGICTYQYDLNERLPTMGGCAHTFCKVCFDDMKSRNQRCPSRCPNTFTTGYSNIALVEVIGAQASAHLPIPKEESQTSPNTNQREEIIPSILPSPPQPSPTPTPAPASVAPIMPQPIPTPTPAPVAPRIPQPTPSPAPFYPEPSRYVRHPSTIVQRWSPPTVSPYTPHPMPAPRMPQPIPTPTLPTVEPRVPRSLLTQHKVQEVFFKNFLQFSSCESQYGHIVPDTVERLNEFSFRMLQPPSSSIPSTSQAPSLTDSDDFDAVKILNETRRDALYAEYIAAFYEKYPDRPCAEIPDSLTLEQQIEVLTGLTEQLSNNTRSTTNSQSSQIRPIRQRFSPR